MRRLKVRYRETAYSDLQNIYDLIYLRSMDRVTARRFMERVQDRCERIGLVPHGGRRRDDLELGLRMVPFEHSAVIAYKVEADCVRITNIFYGGRDYDAFYLDDAEDEDNEQI